MRGGWWGWRVSSCPRAPYVLGAQADMDIQANIPHRRRRVGGREAYLVLATSVTRVCVPPAHSLASNLLTLPPSGTSCVAPLGKGTRART